MTTIVWAGIVLIEPDTPPKSDWAVCIEGNRIVETGSRKEMLVRYPDAELVGGNQLLLMPAFVNSHDHGRGLGAASLGVPDDLLEIWLVKLSSQPSLDPYLAAAYDGIRLLTSGVSTVAHSHIPRSRKNLTDEAAATLQAYKDVGIRVAFHPPIVDQNPFYEYVNVFKASLPSDVQKFAQKFRQSTFLDRSDYFGLCTDLLHSFHDTESHTIYIQVSPAGGQWCSDELISASVEFAQRHSSRVQMHLLETRYQRQYAYWRWGKSFVRHLDEIGALGTWLTCAHMVWVDEEDLSLLAERGVGIAHNPSSNLRLRSGIAPVAQMVEAGIRVGIGLDGHSLEDDQDYLRELRLAWTLGNQPGASSPTLSAQTVGQMGLGGGAAITLGDTVPLGKLAPSYLADLVLIDWQAVEGVWVSPLAGTVETLLRKATRQHVQHVMVNGRWVVWSGQCKTLDEAAVIAALRSELAQQPLAHQPPTFQTLTAYLRRFYAQWD